MATNEGDREDLLAEAVALIRRIEIKPNTESDNLVIGFRAVGWLSIYFGQDLMYQFDEVGRFRRAYVEGLLYRTQGDAVAQLRRERSATESALLRHDLTGDLLTRFQGEVLDKIRWLQALLMAGDFIVLRQVGADDVIPEVSAFLTQVLSSPVFLAPSIKR
jgi:hypothetical protein